MTLELNEIKAGVGALIINPEGKFLTVRENHSRFDNQKIIGMLSFPMETVESLETHQEGMQRLLMGEEIGRVEVYETSLVQRPLNKIQLNPGIWLYTYLLYSKNNLVHPGEAKDVSDISWHDLDPPLRVIDYIISLRSLDSLPEDLDPTVKDAIRKVLAKERRVINFGNLLWRPGVKETIQDYYEYLKSPDDYIPRVHDQASGKVPIEMFSFLEEYKEEEKEQ
ncbi:NUDIX hydrolase [Candidatus Daviesbacteria bacterium]|nr:NUDIX hydrolase [Candidatus Daviesbacteria bacterium]